MTAEQRERIVRKLAVNKARGRPILFRVSIKEREIIAAASPNLQKLDIPEPTTYRAANGKFATKANGLPCWS